MIASGVGADLRKRKELKQIIWNRRRMGRKING